LGPRTAAGALELEQQREIELAGVKTWRDFLGLALGERQLDLRVLRAEHGDRERHQSRAGGRKRGHAQLPAPQPGDRLEIGFGCSQPTEDPFGMREQRAACGRETDAARQALDQRHACLRLERSDLLRDGGLRIRELLGGSGDRALLGDLDENL
jgi:hypothetical protein